MVTNQSLGQAIDTAVNKLDTEKERLSKKLGDLKEKLASIESEISTTQTCLIHTEKERKKAITDALKSAGIDLKDSPVAASIAAPSAPRQNGRRMTREEKDKFVKGLVDIFNKQKDQKFSAGVLAKRIGCESKKIVVLLKSIDGWESVGERVAKRYFVSDAKTATSV
ncbi:MAG: hypothetical protein CMJ18_25140 [Phycisphaeraceae bacterium]|nr:hypothetical protein [Phycisphaeraceae bacterium]